MARKNWTDHNFERIRMWSNDWLLYQAKLAYYWYGRTCADRDHIFSLWLHTLMDELDRRGDGLFDKMLEGGNGKEPEPIEKQSVWDTGVEFPIGFRFSMDGPLKAVVYPEYCNPNND